MKIGIVFLVVLLAGISPVANAENCLAIVDYEITAPTKDFGFVEQQWQAEVENTCDAELYAKITLTFYGSDGEILQESFTSKLVQGRDTVTVTKKAMLTEDIHEAVAETEITVSGKEL